jgi:hypothetical protein
LRELEEKNPNVAIVWRAFELRPDPVPTLDPNGDYLRRLWGSSVYPLAEHLGIDIKLPPAQPARAARIKPRTGRVAMASSGSITMRSFARSSNVARTSAIPRPLLA